MIAFVNSVNGTKNNCHLDLVLIFVIRKRDKGKLLIAFVNSASGTRGELVTVFFNFASETKTHHLDKLFLHALQVGPTQTELHHKTAGPDYKKAACNNRRHPSAG